MMNTVMAYFIGRLASKILTSSVFDRILGVVAAWAEKKISSAEKRHGVLDELEIIGIELTESSARFGVEMAVQYLKRVK